MEALFNNSPEKPKHMKAFSAGAKVTSPGKRSPDKAKVEEQMLVSDAWIQLSCQRHQVPLGRGESLGLESVDLSNYYAIFCSDKAVLSMVSRSL